MKVKLLNYKKHDKYDYTLEVEVKKFLRKPQLYKVRGGPTVWHWLPDCKRCGTNWEWIFANFYNKIVYNEKDKSETYR